MSKKLIGAAVLASGLALGGLAVAAERGAMPGGPGMSPGMGHGMMHGGGHMMHHDPAKHIDGRMAFLKAELKITPAQEKVWGDFEAAARKAAKTASDARAKTKPADPQALTMPERLAHMEKRMATRLESLRTVKGPAEKLYAALSASQKETADDLFKGRMGRF